MRSAARPRCCRCSPRTPTPGATSPPSLRTTQRASRSTSAASSSTCGTLQVPLTMTTSGPWPTQTRMLCSSASTSAVQRRWTTSSRSGRGKRRSSAPTPRWCWLAANWTCGPTWPPCGSCPSRGSSLSLTSRAPCWPSRWGPCPTWSAPPGPQSAVSGMSSTWPPWRPSAMATATATGSCVELTRAEGCSDPHHCRAGWSGGARLRCTRTGPRAAASCEGQGGGREGTAAPTGPCRGSRPVTQAGQQVPWRETEAESVTSASSPALSLPGLEGAQGRWRRAARAGVEAVSP